MMSTQTVARTWSQVIDVEGPPVRGAVSSFESLADKYHLLGNTFEDIASRLSSYQTGDTTRLSGEAARAFDEFSETVLTTISQIPSVSDSVNKILSDHEGSLVELKSEADLALARANTNWSNHNNAYNDLAAARASIQAQGSDLEIEEVAVVQTEEALTASKSEWDRLRSDEQDLDFATARKLRDVELGALADPSWFEALAVGVAKLYFAFSIADDIWQIFADWDGGWGLLWDLKDILETLIVVLSVVAVLAMFFTPIGWVLLAIAISASVLLVLNLAIWGANKPDPDNPGRRVDRSEVTSSGIRALTAWASFGLSGSNLPDGVEGGLKVMGKLTVFQQTYNHGEAAFVDDSASLDSCLDAQTLALSRGEASLSPDRHLIVSAC